MQEKTAKALYDLLKELYQSRTAKEFVDVYEHDRRHRQQAVPVNWSYDKSSAYERLQALCNEEDSWSRNQAVICNAARRLAAACNREERRNPQVGDVYRDILGNSYTVLNVVETFHDETGINRPFVALLDKVKGKILTPTLEEFMNPAFKKV